MNLERNFHFSLLKIRFFLGWLRPPNPPIKNLRQTSDNIACFYNSTLPIAVSKVKKFSTFFCGCKHKGVFSNIICGFVVTSEPSGGSGGRSLPAAEGEKILGVNNPPLR